MRHLGLRLLRGAYFRQGKDIAQMDRWTDRQAERPNGNKKEATERPRRRKRGRGRAGQVSNSRAISSFPVVQALLSSD